VTPTPPAVLLACARLLIEKGWTQGARAVDERGIPCSPLGPRAVRWDLEGALQRAAYYILALPSGANVYAEPAYQEALRALSRSCGPSPSGRPRPSRGTPITAFNDSPGRQPQEILTVLDQALEYLSG
jgi:hypothetical protein